MVIEKEKGSIIRNQQEIVSETKNFYDNLYKSNDIIETEYIHEKLKKI